MVFRTPKLGRAGNESWHSTLDRGIELEFERAESPHLVRYRYGRAASLAVERE